MNKIDEEKLTQSLLFAPRYPARTGISGAAIILGMSDAEIAVLVGAKMLRPLGSPALKAAKLFSTAELFELGRDTAWLGKATKTIQEKWKTLNNSRKNICLPSVIRARQLLL